MLFDSRMGEQKTKVPANRFIVAMAAVFLLQIARPGAEGRNFLLFVSLPFLATAALASEALASAHCSTWGNTIVGSTWLACLLTIPFLAVVPFLALIWALRVGAPTALKRAGAAAGLVAGGLSATACSLPCLDHSFPSITVGYGLPIGLCAIVGAKALWARSGLRTRLTRRCES
jgi:hypothetical protein